MPIRLHVKQKTKKFTMNRNENARSIKVPTRSNTRDSFVPVLRAAVKIPAVSFEFKPSTKKSSIVHTVKPSLSIHKSPVQRSEVLLHRKRPVVKPLDISPSPQRMVAVENTYHMEKPLALTANKAMLLSRAVIASQVITSAKKSKKGSWKKLLSWRSGVALVVVLILTTTGYISFTTWQIDNQAKKAFAASPSTKDILVSSSSSSTDSTGTDNTPISKKTISTYKVAPNLPRTISINKINVDARVLSMGVNSDNSLQVPTNTNDAGWYSESAQPGQAGAMLIDGHASETGTHYGLFGYVDTLKVGDQITVQRGDGVNFTYIIVHTEIDPLEGLDMNKLLLPYGGATQGLNIITCTGKWIDNNTTLDHRLLVFATLKA
jgi:sortase (surface protein transpeptidase)